MFKKIMISMMTLLMVMQPIQALELDISSTSVLLYDLNNDCILYEENKDEIKQIASLTKLMGVIVALEQIDNLQETIVVDGDVISGYSAYSKVGFSDGDELTYEDLLYGMMLPSGADAALLITHHVAGSEEDFAKLMNAKAHQLGMTNSHFDNAIGVDSNQNYSTANDMMKLLKYALKNEKFYEMFTAKEYDIDDLYIEMETTLYAYTRWSDLDVSMLEGTKTGYTDGAGYCLASMIHYQEQPLLLITLGGDLDYRQSAIDDSLQIYETFKEDYEYKSVVDENQVVATVPIKLGWDKTYDIKSPETRLSFVDNTSSYTVDFHGIVEMNRDIEVGDAIGKIHVVQNGYLIETIDIFLEDDIRYHYPLVYALIVLVVLFIGYIIYRKKRRRRRRRKIRR